MAFVLADRVKETTTTTGTGTVTLAGAVSGYQSFTAVGNANTTYYTIAAGTEWEVGLGTYTSAGTTLSRTVVYSSSNAGSLVNFSAGTKDVWVDYPAPRAVYFNGSGTVSLSGGTVTASTPVIEATQTWNDGAVTFIAEDWNITNTASAAASRLARWRVGGTEVLGLSKTQLIMRSGGSASAPDYTFAGDTDTGIYQRAAGEISLTSNGTERFRLESSTRFQGEQANAAAICNTQSTDTVPNLLPRRQSTTTGIGAQAGGNMSFIAVATEVVRINQTNMQYMIAPIAATGGSSAPTLGAAAIGVVGGPATAAQAGWLRMKDSAGADIWIPYWK
jgi:hypothetical protein